MRLIYTSYFLVHASTNEHSYKLVRISYLISFPRACRLDAISEDQAENHANLLTVEERITSIEQKLDAITTLLSSHVST